MIRAEGDVEPRREVREVVGRARVAGLGARMMPMMELGRAEQPAQRPERKPRVGVHEDRPRTAENGDAREELQANAECDGGEVHAELRHEAVERMLAMRGEPVEVLGAVMHNAADFAMTLGEFYCKGLTAPVMVEIKRDDVVFARVYDIRGRSISTLLAIPAP